MIVVADTSPLNYLVLIGAADLLPPLYGSIQTGPACASELSAPGTPEEVRRWFENGPNWLVVTAPRNTSDPRIAHLDNGEQESIALAMQEDVGCRISGALSRPPALATFHGDTRNPT